MIDEYREFIAGKALRAPASGLEDVPPLGDYLFPFQKDLVRWALRRGKAALFCAVGTGKTRMQLEFAMQASAYLEALGETSEVLIVTPLAVAAQTVREGEVIGIACKYCKTSADMVSGRITVTNYDRLDRFDPSRFGVIVLDESSCLKHQDSKTRTRIIEAFRNTPFRLACTATPAPNDRKELGNHAEFLGVMSLSEMLSEFFVHDSGKTQQWRLKGHAEQAFWKWVASWGAMVTKPSDLGYDDARYNLPPLRIFDHMVRATSAQDRATREEKCDVCAGEGKQKNDPALVEIGEDDFLECENCVGTGKIIRGQLTLFPMAATNLKTQRKARRATLTDRVAKAVEIVSKEPGEQWLIWCELNDEANAVEHALREIPGIGAGVVQVCGSDASEFKADAAIWFSSGKGQRPPPVRAKKRKSKAGSAPIEPLAQFTDGGMALVSKGSIFGFGLNFQSCARTLFVGVSHKFEEVHQSLGRNHRFGQTREVHAHFVYSELEGDVRDNLRRKAREFEEMATMMRGIVAGYVQQNVLGLNRETTPYEPTVPMAYSEWLSENAEV